MPNDLSQIIGGAVERIVSTFKSHLSAAVDKRVASEVTRLAPKFLAQRERHSKAKRKPLAVGPVTRWVADASARRVPNFVLEQTGLKTKQAIIDKYGNGTAFKLGKEPESPTPRVVIAKGPIVRKAANQSEERIETPYREFVL